MTDRERLIELMQKCDIVQIQTSKFIEGFADYLLEHGVIVLPCKVGERGVNKMKVLITT